LVVVVVRASRAPIASIGIAGVLAFAFGYSLTFVPLLRAGISRRRAADLALAADTLSIIVMELVDIAAEFVDTSMTSLTDIFSMGEFLDRPARLSPSLREREGNVGLTPDKYQILPPSSNDMYTKKRKDMAHVHFWG